MIFSCTFSFGNISDAEHARLLFLLIYVLSGPGLDFHEDLHRIGAKEGLKGRKLQKAMESYAWNITVLKVSGTPCCFQSTFTSLLRSLTFHQESLGLL